MSRNIQMAVSALATLGFCLVVLAARSQSAGPHHEKPRVVATATERDLGSVLPTALATASFEVGNAGKRRLILREDRCSGCGQAEWIIEPGERENLTIPFDATGLQGSVRQVRHFTTNDPALPRLTLTIVATVRDSSSANEN